MLEYCLVLGAGDEDLQLVMDNVALLFQKAGVGVPVPEWCDVWFVRDMVVQVDECLKGREEVLGEEYGVWLELMLYDVQKPKHWKVEEGVGVGALN